MKVVGIKILMVIGSLWAAANLINAIRELIAGDIILTVVSVALASLGIALAWWGWQTVTPKRKRSL